MARKTNDDYLTPLWLTDALGAFRLDPCDAPHNPNRHARDTYSLPIDGLVSVWYGRVWLNPPYSKPAPWMARMAAHRNGISIVNAAFTTRWWNASVWEAAHAIKLLSKRVDFEKYNAKRGNVEAVSQPMYESVLVAYGIRNAISLLRLNRSKDPRLQGPVFILWRNWFKGTAR